ncbi:hypothetical protein CDEST_07048 [Colletotrichum destructivum]|uniref:Uncharacterized protein n=1 Tax=Colletotrichum destructivum TaxID=34406 RepID=A0AAX4IFG8_9PEZI|nr:hypothetical protein CDEST_07048 [Colletotrichum destructivum]
MTSAALPMGYAAPKGGDGGLGSEVAFEDVVLVARLAALTAAKGRGGADKGNDCVGG